MSSEERPWTAAYRIGQPVEVLDQHDVWMPGFVAGLSPTVASVHVTGSDDDETIVTRRASDVRPDDPLTGPEHEADISAAVAGTRLLLEGLAHSTGTAYAVPTAITFLLAEFALDTKDGQTEAWIDTLAEHAKLVLPKVRAARAAAMEGSVS